MGGCFGSVSKFSSANVVMLKGAGVAPVFERRQARGGGPSNPWSDATLFFALLVSFVICGRKYSVLQPPYFMTKEVMAGVAQLEQFDEELYKVRTRPTQKFHSCLQCSLCLGSAAIFAVSRIVIWCVRPLVSGEGWLLRLSHALRSCCHVYRSLLACRAIRDTVVGFRFVVRG